MEKINMTLTADENINSAEILLEGNIDIDNMAAITQEISALSDKYSTLKFQIQNVTKIDLAGIQFFYSVQKKMKNGGKKVLFEFKLDEKDENLIEATGFSELLKNKL